MSKKNMPVNRDFLKSNLFTKEGRMSISSDQMKKKPAPPLQKPYPKDVSLLNLIQPEDFQIGNIPLIDVINKRRSHRRFTKEQFTLEELSFLLWATQGVQYLIGGGNAIWRTVPSGGARHPFETYLYLSQVDGLQPGLYRYLSIEHKLYLLRTEGEISSIFNKTLVAKAPIVFIWTAIPYRTEWRYGDFSYKTIVQETGHVCQNLYLASEAIGAGCCAVGAYNQEIIDEFLGVDGEDEFTVYTARVGKIKQSSKSLQRMAETLHGYRTR
ncbi:MAG: SagB/ThcOx family dehydrogenase [Candidatus Hermodarchaeota archaeon]